MENFVIYAVQILSLLGFFGKSWLSGSLKNEVENTVRHHIAGVSVKLDRA